MAKITHVRITVSFLLAFSLIAAVLVTAEDVDSGAKEILARYLAIPHSNGPSITEAYDPKIDKEVNKARQTRLAILAELKAIPAEAMPVVEQALFDSASPKQRLEIVGSIANIHTNQCADLLCRVLKDVREPEGENNVMYEELVRSSACHGLRKMARRIDCSGGKRVVHGAAYEPTVSGLVPNLIMAAHDPAERVRVTAMYALADCRDPLAVAELKRRLKDNSEKVRLYAACFLTEYENASGLLELRKAISRFRGTRSDSKDSFERYLQMEMLLASLERITGKSFGEIPLNPLWSSRSDGYEVKQYEDLLDRWQAWWDWQPDGCKKDP